MLAAAAAAVSSKISFTYIISQKLRRRVLIKLVGAEFICLRQHEWRQVRHHTSVMIRTVLQPSLIITCEHQLEIRETSMRAFSLRSALAHRSQSSEQ
jgi:hypothetical protein